jgi:hypothetical protein
MGEAVVSGMVRVAQLAWLLLACAPARAGCEPRVKAIEAGAIGKSENVRVKNR